MCRVWLSNFREFGSSVDKWFAMLSVQIYQQWCKHHLIYKNSYSIPTNKKKKYSPKTAFISMLNLKQ